MTRIFKLSVVKDAELKLLYSKAIDELNEFTKLNWKHSLPLMYLMEGRSIANLWQERSNTKMSGWTYGSHQFYVLDKETFIAQMGESYKEGDYYKLIKHELAHCFYQVLTNGLTKPVWLWEGFAVYVSGQYTDFPKINKFKRFLDITETHEDDIYNESGNVVDHLIKLKGRETFIEMLKKINEVNLEELLYKYYGIKMNYKDLNSLLNAL